MAKPLALASLSLLAIAVAPAVASASGFETARMGGEHGNPTTSNPTAMYFNPAGLAESTGTNLYVEYYLAMRGASYTHAPAASDTPEPMGEAGANNGKGTLFNLAGAPMIGASTKLGNLALGASFFVPIGGTEKWDKNTAFSGDKKYPGSVDGPQRWYSISGSILSMYFSLAAAYKFPGTGLSLGLTGNLIRSSIQTVRARTAVGNDDMDAEGRVFLDASGFQGSFAAGAMYEAVPKKLWIGASYQARPNVAGGMKLNGTLKTYFAGTESPTAVAVRQDLPDIIRLGVRVAATPELELRLHGAWERWSAFKDQCISAQAEDCKVNPDGSPAEGTNPIQNLPHHWHDSFSVHGGASYFVSPSVELFGGVQYDSAATPAEALQPVVMDLSSVSVGGGARLALGSHLHAALSYTQLIFFSRDTTGQSLDPTYPSVSRGPDAGGQYSEWVGLINAHLEASF